MKENLYPFFRYEIFTKHHTYLFKILVIAIRFERLALPTAADFQLPLPFPVGGDFQFPTVTDFQLPLPFPVGGDFQFFDEQLFILNSRSLMIPSLLMSAKFDLVGQ